MLPGINPQQMAQAMKKLGIKQQEIDSYEVVIKTKEKNLIIKNPQVVKINMSGQESFQITGDAEEESNILDALGSALSADENVSKEAARKALEENNGDLADTILKLQNK